MLTRLINVTSNELTETEKRYKELFDSSPVAMREEDFSLIKAYFDTLQANGITDFESYFAKHPESVEFCAKLAKCINSNKAAAQMIDPKSKESIGSLSNIFRAHTLEVFRQELVLLAQGKTTFKITDFDISIGNKQSKWILYFNTVSEYTHSLKRVIVSIVSLDDWY